MGAEGGGIAALFFNGLCHFPCERRQPIGRADEREIMQRKIPAGLPDNRFSLIIRNERVGRCAGE